MHNTPDWVFQQAYTDKIKAGANRRMVAKQPGQEWGTPLETSDYHNGLHLPSHRETLTVQFQGKLVRAKIHKSTDQPHKAHKRGKITGFSAQSRGRLFDIFNSMEIRNPVIFITLTYLSEEINCETSKSHLRAFIKRLQRLFPRSNMSFVWRMEFQERGAIHYHILAFGLPFTPKEVIQRMWGEIISEICPFTRIEMIYSAKKIMNYVSKYVAKVDKQALSGFNSLTYLSAYQKKHGDETGRVWGIIGKQFLPMAELVICEVGFQYAKFMQFKEFAAQLYPPLMESLSLGFRLYVMSAKHWEYLFHRIYDIQF